MLTSIKMSSKLATIIVIGCLLSVANNIIASVISQRFVSIPNPLYPTGRIEFAVKEPVLTFIYNTTYPASITLGSSYTGPQTPTNAFWRSGTGAWNTYTSKTLTLSSSTLEFKGDWRTSAGNYNAMFNNTFPAINGTLSVTGGFNFNGAPQASMFYNTFSGCSGLTGSIPVGLFGNISGVPQSYMFYDTFNGCSKLTGSIPVGLFGNISGAPQSYMFYGTFYGCSGLTGSIPVGLFGNISGAPQASMFRATFSGCSKLTGSSALMPDGTTKLYNQFPTATVIHCDNCYLNASGLSDYSTIPAAWK